MNEIYMASFRLTDGINPEVYIKNKLANLTDEQHKIIIGSFLGYEPDDLDEYSDELGGTYRKFVKMRMNLGVEEMLRDAHIHETYGHRIYVIAGNDDGANGMFDYYTLCALLEAEIV